MLLESPPVSWAATTREEDLNVSHPHRFVFLGNHRTGSRVVFAALRDRYGCLGEVGRPTVLTHSIGVPPGAEDYLVIATVRHPGSRLVSIWQWMKQVIGGWPDDSVSRFVRANFDDFSGFVRAVDEAGPHHGGAFESQFRRLAPARAPNYLLRFESLREDFLGLPFVSSDDPGPDLRPPNPTTTDWWTLYTPDALTRMERLYADDLKEFDYA